MSDTKTALAIPDPQAIDKAVQPMLQKIREINIVTEEDYYNSGTLLKELEAGEKTFLPPFESNKKVAKAAYDSAKALYDRFANPLDAAKKFLSQKRSEYRQRVEQARIDKQNAINAENKRIADEAARVERERLAKIAADAESELIAAVEAELEEANRKAEELRASGKTEEAEKLAVEAATNAGLQAQSAATLRVLDDLDIEEAVAASVPEPEQIVLAAPVLAKTAGVGLRRNYKFEVTDINALPAKYIKPREADLVAIGKDVREQKEATSMTPTPSTLIKGISVFFEETDFTRKEKNKDDF